jgi:hypothetical protein
MQAMQEKMQIWNAVKQPPKTALRQIGAGRLKGKTDINPQWRYQAMTEQFGPCGIGWRYEVVRLWQEAGTLDQVFAFAEIKLFVKEGDKWSEGIPGIGGSMLIAKESSGLHSNDEAYKMAITDALSVAMKMLGVAADVYAGMWDGDRFKGSTTEPSLTISPEQIKVIKEYLASTKADEKKFLAFYKISRVDELTVEDYPRAIAALKTKKEAKGGNN